MKQFEVVTVGGALKDIMFYTDQAHVVKNPKDVACQKLLAFEYGAKIPVQEVFVNYGGGAMNVAVGLKNFGIDVAPMVCVGRDSVGKEIYSHLKSLGISTYLMRVDAEKKTGFSVVVTSAKDKDHTIFAYKGANDHLEIFGLKDFRTQWFYVSSSNRKDWAFEFEKITRQTKRNVRIVWNPGERQLREHEKMVRFLPEIEVLILNKDEAIELVEHHAPRATRANLESPRFLLKTIKDMGPQKVVITQGARGVVAIDEREYYYYESAMSVHDKIVDTVGAGDAFSSGLVAGLVRWGNFNKALKLGMRNSAMVLYRIGAQNGLIKVKL